MSFLAVLLALLVEQLKPLPRDNPVHHMLVAWVAWTGRSFDAGGARHAWIVWGIGVLAPALLTALAWVVLRQYTLLGALAMNVVLLYLTLGFRQFSHFYTRIRDALAEGDESRARAILTEWRHLDVGASLYLPPLPARRCNHQRRWHRDHLRQRPRAGSGAVGRRVEWRQRIVRGDGWIRAPR